jgi:hypothetical protein
LASEAGFSDGSGQIGVLDALGDILLGLVFAALALAQVFWLRHFARKNRRSWRL